MDHLIHTVVVDLLPYHENHHNSQELGFSSSNLAQKRRKELLARTPEMNADSIHSTGDDRYYVQLAIEPSCTYLVELGKQSCNSADWPRVQLCKHVTSVAHFFGNSELLADQFAVAPGTVSPVESENPLDNARSSEAVASMLENVITVSKEILSDGVSLSLGTVRSLHMVEAHLHVVVQNSRSSESPLPEKENIAPNQHTWTETAWQMVTQRRKRPRPASMSSPEPPAMQCIGDLNRKQPRMLTDLYTGGVNSGRTLHPTHVLLLRTPKHMHTLQPQPME